jgi:hypothetical protein
VFFKYRFNDNLLFSPALILEIPNKLLGSVRLGRLFKVSRLALARPDLGYFFT